MRYFIILVFVFSTSFLFAQPGGSNPQLPMQFDDPTLQLPMQIPNLPKDIPLDGNSFYTQPYLIEGNEWIPLSGDILEARGYSFVEEYESAILENPFNMGIPSEIPDANTLFYNGMELKLSESLKMDIDYLLTDVIENIDSQNILEEFDSMGQFFMSVGSGSRSFPVRNETVAAASKLSFVYTTLYNVYYVKNDKSRILVNPMLPILFIRFMQYLKFHEPNAYDFISENKIEIRENFIHFKIGPAKAFLGNKKGYTLMDVIIISHGKDYSVFINGFKCANFSQPPRDQYSSSWERMRNESDINVDIITYIDSTLYLNIGDKDNE